MNEAIGHALQNYAVFRGRTTRRNFWLWYLFTILLTIPTNIVDAILFAHHTYVQNLVGIFVFLPTLSAGVRRMHDVGKRGWWLIVPFANLFFLVQPSGPMNQFEI
jgi:uncharacterized membrane protein YhaH (DUF805 family)